MFVVQLIVLPLRSISRWGGKGSSVRWQAHIGRAWTTCWSDLASHSYRDWDQAHSSEPYPHKPGPRWLELETNSFKLHSKQNLDKRFIARRFVSRFESVCPTKSRWSPDKAVFATRQRCPCHPTKMCLSPEKDVFVTWKSWFCHPTKLCLPPDNFRQRSGPTTLLCARGEPLTIAEAMPSSNVLGSSRLPVVVLSPTGWKKYTIVSGITASSSSNCVASHSWG